MSYKALRINFLLLLAFGCFFGVSSAGHLVSCKLTIDNKVDGVYYNGKRLKTYWTGTQQRRGGDDANWPNLKTIHFHSTPGGVLAIGGHNYEKQYGHGTCRTAGFVINCRSKDPAWNRVASDDKKYGWKVFGSRTALRNGWYHNSANTRGWGKPCYSTSSFATRGGSAAKVNAGGGSAKPIWGGNKYSYFRIRRGSRRKPRVTQVRGYRVQAGRDVGGHDIRCYTDGRSVHRCAAECNRNPKCVAINQVHRVRDRKYPNWGHKSGCCMKTRSSNPGRNPNVDFYVKTGKRKVTKKCISWGDPHLTTFNGRKYNDYRFGWHTLYQKGVGSRALVVEQHQTGNVRHFNWGRRLIASAVSIQDGAEEVFSSGSNTRGQARGCAFHTKLGRGVRRHGKYKWSLTRQGVHIVISTKCTAAWRHYRVEITTTDQGRGMCRSADDAKNHAEIRNRAKTRQVCGLAYKRVMASCKQSLGCAEDKCRAMPYKGRYTDSYLLKLAGGDKKLLARARNAARSCTAKWLYQYHLRKAKEHQRKRNHLNNKRNAHNTAAAKYRRNKIAQKRAERINKGHAATHKRHQSNHLRTKRREEGNAKRQEGIRRRRIANRNRENGLSRRETKKGHGHSANARNLLNKYRAARRKAAHHRGKARHHHGREIHHRNRKNSHKRSQAAHKRAENLHNNVANSHDRKAKRFGAQAKANEAAAAANRKAAAKHAGRERYHNGKRIFHHHKHNSHLHSHRHWSRRATQLHAQWRRAVAMQNRHRVAKHSWYQTNLREKRARDAANKAAKREGSLAAAAKKAYNKHDKLRIAAQKCYTTNLAKYHVWRREAAKARAQYIRNGGIQRLHLTWYRTNKRASETYKGLRNAARRKAAHYSRKLASYTRKGKSHRGKQRDHTKQANRHSAKSRAHLAQYRKHAHLQRQHNSKFIRHRNAANAHHRAAKSLNRHAQALRRAKKAADSAARRHYLASQRAKNAAKKHRAKAEQNEEKEIEHGWQKDEKQEEAEGHRDAAAAARRGARKHAATARKAHRRSHQGKRIANRYKAKANHHNRKAAGYKRLIALAKKKGF